jgi:hypothetical protein
MSKASKAATLSTDVVSPAEPVTTAPAAASAATLDVRPDFLTISDYAYKALPAAVALIRMGWSLSTDYPPTTFENTGYVTITLDRKKIAPEIMEVANKIATEEERLAVARAAIDFERRVQEAAKAVVESEKKAAAAAELAAEIASRRAALQALEQAAATA